MPAAPTLPATQRPRAGSPSDSPVWHCCSHAPGGAGRPCAPPLAYNLQIVGRPRHFRSLHPELYRTCRCDIGGRVGSPCRTQSTLRVALRLSLTINLTLPWWEATQLAGLVGGSKPSWVTQAVRAIIVVKGALLASTASNPVPLPLVCAYPKRACLEHWGCLLRGMMWESVCSR